MSSNTLKQLIKMANEIVLNQTSVAIPESTTVESSASHITRFWTPDMRKTITAYLEEDGALLEPLTQQVIRKVAH